MSLNPYSCTWDLKWIADCIIPIVDEQLKNMIFIFIIWFIVFEFILTKTLSYLNTLNWSEELPEELKWIYDEEKYIKSQKYEKTKHKFSLFSTTFSFVIMIIVLIAWWFWLLDNFLRNYIANSLVLALSFFWIIVLLQTIISIPFSYYSTFVIEEKFGFNKSTKKIFFFDIIKSILLSFIIWGLLLSLIVYVYSKLGDSFWWTAWIIMSLFSLFFMLFYSTLIVPLFNKQTPLEEWELKNKISEFASKVWFKLDNIFVIDWSKRSSKANAYFTWFWAKKRIVLYDTLIKDLTEEEIVAVLAHEIWHYKKKHTIQMLVYGILQTWFMMYLFSLALKIPEVSFALWAVPSFHVWLIAFSILFMPLSIILSLFWNILSRKNEYQADEFAWVNYDSSHLQSALIKLSQNNLSNLRPHKAYEFFYYSHPTVLKRLAFLEKFKKVW